MYIGYMTEMYDNAHIIDPDTSACSSLFIDRIDIHINRPTWKFHFFTHNNRDLDIW